MAQTTPLTIPDSNGATFLADVNAKIAALFSENSGASAPSTTVGGMIWFDTGVSPPVLRYRNSANGAWVDIAPETLAANSLWGNPTGSAAKLQTTSMAQLRTMIGFPTAAAGLGEWEGLNPSVSVALVLPAGGTWAYSAYRFNSGVVSNGAFGVDAGGTTVGAALAGHNWSGFAWRIA